MPAQLKQYDPSLREKIAAMLQGDVKQGSMRSHIARAMAGSSVGGESDGIPLLDLTPAGVAFSANDAERALNKGQYGNAAIAAAGMIPGASAARPAAHELKNFINALKEAHFVKGDEAASQLWNKLTQKYKPMNDEMLSANIERDISGPDLEALRAQFDPKYKALDQSRFPKMDRVNTPMRESLKRASIDTDPARAEALSKQVGKIENRAMKRAGGEHPPGTRFEGVSDDEFDDAISPGMELRSDIEDHGNRSAQRSWEEGLNRGDPQILDELYGKDPHKLNFIKNAMSDEGGNAPEDVAMTVLDHMKQKDPPAYAEEVANSGGEKAAVKNFVAAYSVPEMLSIHYDLDPSKFKSAYAKPKGRPTQ